MLKLRHEADDSPDHSLPMTLTLRATRLSRDPDRNNWSIHEIGRLYEDRPPPGPSPSVGEEETLEFKLCHVISGGSGALSRSDEKK